MDNYRCGDIVEIDKRGLLEKVEKYTDPYKSLLTPINLISKFAVINSDCDINGRYNINISLPGSNQMKEASILEKNIIKMADAGQYFFHYSDKDAKEHPQWGLGEYDGDDFIDSETGEIVNDFASSLTGGLAHPEFRVYGYEGRIAKKVNNVNEYTKSRNKKQEVDFNKINLDESLFERIEELSDDYYDVYITNSIYDIRNYILGHPDNYRFIYCGSSGYYLIAKSRDYVHLDLAALAIKNRLTSDRSSQDAICYPKTADIVSFNYTPGIFENTEEGKDKLLDCDCQLPYYYQYEHGAIGYRGTRDNSGLDAVLGAFGKPLYIIDISDRCYVGFSEK